MPLRHPLVLLLLALAAGCDRPFVAVAPPTVEVVAPTDLGDVREDETLDLALRVSAVRSVERVAIAGVAATPSGGLYRRSLTLGDGLNAIPVEAEDVDGNVARDTLYALFQRFTGGTIPSADLPEGLAYHTATPLPDGRVLVAGGVDALGAASDALYAVSEPVFFQFSVAAVGTLARARAGHAAVPLADGRVLVLGGATRAEPVEPFDLVATAELVDPATGASTVLPTRGAPLRRAGHAALRLEQGGRTFVFVWGGRAASGDGLVTPTGYEILELTRGAAGDSLVTLSPPGGVGSLQPVTRPAAAAFPPLGGVPRAVSTGLYVPDRTPVASELRFRTGTGLYPFEILERALVPPAEPRDAGALAPFADGLALLVGGRTTPSAPSAALDVAAVAAGRFFRVPPAAAALRLPRYGHSATLLAGGRILVLGGYSGSGSPTASAELILPQ